MGKIDFYRRYLKNGAYETICTRCFATLGSADDRRGIERLEAEHACPVKLQAPERGSSASGREAPAPRFLALPPGNALLLLFSMILCLYLLPTVIELEMLKHISVWVSCIFFGDLVGCSFLSLGLGWRKTGVALYLALTAVETCVYLGRVASPHELAWLADMVPTCVAAFFLFRSRRLKSLLRSS
jgi:hypothetical protein